MLKDYLMAVVKSYYHQSKMISFYFFLFLIFHVSSSTRENSYRNISTSHSHLQPVMNLLKDQPIPTRPQNPSPHPETELEL